MQRTKRTNKRVGQTALGEDAGKIDFPRHPLPGKTRISYMLEGVIRLIKSKRIRIKTFRCWRDQTVEVDTIRCLLAANRGWQVGPAVSALNLFFRHPQYSPMDVVQLHEEDFYSKDTIKPFTVIAYLRSPL